MRINKERSGCRIVVETDLSQGQIREAMNKAADILKNAFIPTDIFWQNGMYSFYVRHRMSLQEYIFNGTLSIEDFKIFLHNSLSVLEECEREGVDIYDMVLDYECIFIGANLSDIEFVYAPGDNNGEMNSLTELYSVLGLNIKTISEKEDREIREILDCIADWERSDNENRYLSSLIQVLGGCEKANGETSLVLSWKPFIYFQIVLVFIIAACMYLKPFGGYAIFAILAGILLTVCVDFLLIPGMNRLSIQKVFVEYKGKLCKLKEVLAAFIKVQKLYIRKSLYSIVIEEKISGEKVKVNLFKTGKDIVNCGRDKEWADICFESNYVSRRHIIFVNKEGVWEGEDCGSTNGTEVNGKKVTKGSPVIIKRGGKVTLGAENIV